jgi:hypothetical protein
VVPHVVEQAAERRARLGQRACLVARALALFLARVVVIHLFFLTCSPALVSPLLRVSFLSFLFLFFVFAAFAWVVVEDAPLL